MNENYIISSLTIIEYFSLVQLYLYDITGSPNNCLHFILHM